MNLKAMFEEKRAVSPVIGVILMVAITVILAAVIGTFVLGLGDQVGDSAPNTNWDVEANSTSVTFTHSGGDQVDSNTLMVTVDGDDKTNQAYINGSTGDNLDTVDRGLTAGDSITVDGSNDDVGDGDTVRLIWESGDRSTILRTVEASD